MRRLPVIERLEIRRFRGIESGSIPLAPFTVLLGLNGSGKTAVLEALYLAANPREGTLLVEEPDPIGRFPLRHVFQRHGYPNLETRELEGVLELQTESEDPQAPSAEPAAGDQERTREEKPPRHLVRMLLSRPRWLNYRSADSAEILLIAPRAEMTRSRWKQMLRAALMDPETGEEVEESLWFGEEETPVIWKGERDRWVADRLKEIYGLGPLRLSGGKGGRAGKTTVWAIFEHGAAIPIPGMGDGIQAAFRALCMLAILQEGLFLWDEPEAHQHAEAIPRLMNALVDTLAERDHLQIVLATQSLEILKALRDIFMGRSDREVFSMVFLRRDERTGELESHSFSMEDLDLMLQTEQDPRVLIRERLIPPPRPISQEALEELAQILRSR
jgi:energy-coupling factor transporter ATP-binding protein EcfA2